MQWFMQYDFSFMQYFIITNVHSNEMYTNLIGSENIKCNL